MGQRIVVMAKRYEGEPCGYIYDPRIGDTDGGIAPGVSFEELPENCRAYLKRIEEFTNTRISLVSVGPDRENNILIHEI